MPGQLAVFIFSFHLGQIKSRTERIIIATLFFSFNAPFGTIINGWNARQRVRSVYSGKRELCCSACWPDGPHHDYPQRNKGSSFINTAILIEFPPDRMSDLKIIVIVMTGIETLVQFIVRHGMKDLIVGPAGIIPMDHFAHQPEIFFFLRSSPAHLFHEIKGQAVCTVQTDAVDVKLPDQKWITSKR